MTNTVYVKVTGQEPKPTRHVIPVYDKPQPKRVIVAAPVFKKGPPKPIEFYIPGELA